MDTQAAMYWQTIGIWVQAFILLGTAIIVGYYTKETWKLRKEAQRQTELQLRPFIILEGPFSLQENRGKFQVRNVGNGTAINIRVKDILADENLKVVFRFPQQIPFLQRGQRTDIQHRTWVETNQMSGTESAPYEHRLLQRPLLPLNIPQQSVLPEVIVEFENVERQRYVVKERLLYGELEIVDSGRLDQQ